MAKIEIDDSVVDKLVGKRVVEFNKTVRTLETKLARRDSKIKKLERELELLKADKMSVEPNSVAEIGKVAQALVYMMQEMNWVEAADSYCDNCHDD